MSALGFAGSGLSTIPDGPPRPFWEANFGLADSSRASQYGYGVPDLSSTSRAAPSDEELRALYGVEAGESVQLTDAITGLDIGGLEQFGGCLGEADRAVYGDFDVKRRYMALRISGWGDGVE
jgi:hypothetical protein